MAVYGLTTEGFVVKTLGAIRDDINIAIRHAFGSSVRLDDESIFGQIIGIISERLAVLWEHLEAINSGRDPDSAKGSALEQICLLTGTLRPQATYSTVTLTLTGTNATNVPSGTQFDTISTESVFETSALAVLATVSDWNDATAYVVGDRVKSNGGAYQCIVAGTSHATTGPGPAPLFPHPDTSADQEFDAITDNTVTWIYLGDGAAVADVLARSAITGPVVATAHDIRGSESLVSAPPGLSGVINLLDATLGSDIAADADLRILRENELANGGSTTVDALIAEIGDLDRVKSVYVFENVDDVTDSDGVPPHAIEALVRCTETPDAEFDQSIWDALLAGKAAGIKTHGDVIGTATDSKGTAHTMKFTRPEEIEIYVIITLTKDPDLYPLDGDDQVAQAIVDFGDLQDTGKNAVASSISAQAFKVLGVLDVVTCFIDDAPAPAASTTIPISLRQLAVFDTSRIIVNSSDAVP